MSELLEYDGRKLNNLPRGDISNMLDLAAAKLVAKGYNPFQIAQILNYHGGFITQDHDVFMFGILLFILYIKKILDAPEVFGV